MVTTEQTSTLHRSSGRKSMWDAVAFVGLSVLGGVMVVAGLTYLLINGAERGWNDDDEEKKRVEAGKKAGEEPAVKVEGVAVLLPGGGVDVSDATEPQGEPVRQAAALADADKPA